MRTYLTLLTMALLSAACTDNNATAPRETDTGRENSTRAETAASQPAAVSASGPAANAAADDAGTASAPPAALGGRTGELTNPDNSAMVFLYYDLAGMPPPIDHWVEEDSRVKYAAAPDKAARREAVRAEFESGAAAVHGIGFVRLTMNADLSDYDPTYGEFSVRALAPGSVVSFDALGQKIALKFGNGRTAQIWRVPPEQAQAIRDKIGFSGNVSLDVLLSIAAVQPGPAGGTITANVLEYEMHESRSGITIARVRVPPR